MRSQVVVAADLLRLQPGGGDCLLEAWNILAFEKDQRVQRLQFG